MKIEISWLTQKRFQEPQPTPILQEPSRVYQYKNWYSWKRSTLNVLLEYQLINLRRVSVWNSSQLLSVPSESEVLLPICYQIRNKIVWI